MTANRASEWGQPLQPAQQDWRHLQPLTVEQREKLLRELPSWEELQARAAALVQADIDGI